MPRWPRKETPVQLMKMSENQWMTPDGRFRVERTYARTYTRGPFKAWYDLRDKRHPGEVLKVGVPTLKEVKSHIEEALKDKTKSSARSINVVTTTTTPPAPQPTDREKVLEEALTILVSAIENKLALKWPILKARAALAGGEA